MSSITDRFSRLAALRPPRTSGAHTPRSLRAAGEEDALARLIGAGVARNRFGEHLCARNWFSTPEYTAVSKVALELLARGRDEAVSRRTRAALEDPSRWLFLDTETTGLAGGTGTYAFLVGIAWWDADGLQCEQFFMRDFSEEYSLLEELAARIAERPVLVTFNGKSFDWPLLDSRFTLTRRIAVPELAAHLDLLHPARALWKLRLGSVRLKDLERHVLDAPLLGWDRENDVDSALIPQFYFDYLRGGPAKPLAGVVRHNQMDLRGLAALMGKISTLLADTEHGAGSADEALDLFGLSRYLHRRGERGRARTACEQALGAGLPAAFRPQASRELASMAARQGDHDRAASLWEELLQHSGDTVRACEQLAIHYERRIRDLPRAADYAQLGLEKLRILRSQPGNVLSAGQILRQEEKFKRRVVRLKGRMRRNSSTASRALPQEPASVRAERTPAPIATAG